MTVVEYLEAVKERLLLDHTIDEFHVIRERVTATDGYLRVKMLLADGGMLECAEYFQRNPQGEIDIVTYSHHWADKNSVLIMRWDNTLHFPDLPNFPDHVHDGRTGIIRSSLPMGICAVLDEIARKI
ncbi:MAG: hypothetical protein GY801_43200 [bacterium]|nr:hypothetical protein [bacterium]